MGKVEIDIPRDRNGEFELQLIKKNQTSISVDMENKIISMYAKGMSTADIEAHIRDIYGLDGNKDVLGMWGGENESVKFWANVLNSMKNRGLEDILIACTDNLSGFSQAINAVFPQTDIQNCIIHQLRNSSKYVSYKDLKELMLKMLYLAIRTSRKGGQDTVRNGVRFMLSRLFSTATEFRNNILRLDNRIFLR